MKKMLIRVLKSFIGASEYICGCRCWICDGRWYRVSGRVDSNVWDNGYKNSWDVGTNFGYKILFSDNFGARAFIGVRYGTFLIA